jgi:hypothetical protein
VEKGRAGEFNVGTEFFFTTNHNFFHKDIDDDDYEDECYDFQDELFDIFNRQINMHLDIKSLVSCDAIMV